jgi:hypothetical protein
LWCGLSPFPDGLNDRLGLWERFRRVQPRNGRVPAKRHRLLSRVASPISKRTSPGLVALLVRPVFRAEDRFRGFGAPQLRDSSRSRGLPQPADSPVGPSDPFLHPSGLVGPLRSRPRFGPIPPQAKGGVRFRHVRPQATGGVRFRHVRPQATGGVRFGPIPPQATGAGLWAGYRGWSEKPGEFVLGPHHWNLSIWMELTRGQAISFRPYRPATHKIVDNFPDRGKHWFM